MHYNSSVYSSCNTYCSNAMEAFENVIAEGLLQMPCDEPCRIFVTTDNGLAIRFDAAK